MESGVKVQASFKRFSCSSIILAALLCAPFASHAQEAWFKTGTGLGVEKPRIAVADFAPRADNAKPHATLFTQVVRDDLSFSGIIDLVSPSFYPAASSLRSQRTPETHLDRSSPQRQFRRLRQSHRILHRSRHPRLDVRRPQPLQRTRRRQGLSRRSHRRAGPQIRSPVRRRNHLQTFRRLPRRGGNANCLHQLAHRHQRTLGHGLRRRQPAPTHSLRSISLTPRWSPDASRIAFTCFAPANSVVSARSACTPSTPTSSSLSRATEAPTPLPPGLPTARRLCSRPPCRAIPRSTSPTPAAIAPSASPLQLRRRHFSPPGIPKPARPSPSSAIAAAFRSSTDEFRRHQHPENRSPRHGLRHRSRLVSQRTAPRLQLAPPLRQLRHLRHGRRHRAASSNSPATPAATNAPAGPPTAATSSSNPPAPAPAKSGPC